MLFPRRHSLWKLLNMYRHSIYVPTNLYSLISPILRAFSPNLSHFLSMEMRRNKKKGLRWWGFAGGSEDSLTSASVTSREMKEKHSLYKFYSYRVKNL